MQKRAIRIIHNVWDSEHTNKLFFFKPQVMKFMNLVQFKTTQVMFKTRNTMFPSNIQNLFKNREGRYGMSGKCNLKQPCAANALKNMCISVCGVTLWNSPDKEIKESKNIA